MNQENQENEATSDRRKQAIERAKQEIETKKASERTKQVRERIKRRPALQEEVSRCSQIHFQDRQATERSKRTN